MTNAVVANCVVCVPGAAVAAEAMPLNVGPLICAPPAAVMSFNCRVTAPVRPLNDATLPDAIAAKKKRWALVYPNFEYGQSAVAAFKSMLSKAQPNVEFVTEQAPPLGKVDAGAVVQAIDDAKPDAIFNVLFGADLAKFVREGTTRDVFSYVVKSQQ